MIEFFFKQMPQLHDIFGAMDSQVNDILHQFLTKVVDHIHKSSIRDKKESYFKLKGHHENQCEVRGQVL